jgi:translation initiation factor SUI1
MSVQNLNTFGSYLHPYPSPLFRSTFDLSLDPFADAADPLSAEEAGRQSYIHIRIQQRNGRKTLTTLQGLPKGES